MTRNAPIAIAITITAAPIAMPTIAPVEIPLLPPLLPVEVARVTVPVLLLVGSEAAEEALPVMYAIAASEYT